MTKKQEFDLKFKYDFNLPSDVRFNSIKYWFYICLKRKLSEDFIREYQNHVSWLIISQHQTLSEDFIKEFKDRVDWRAISKFQTLSDEFREEMKEYLR